MARWNHTSEILIVAVYFNWSMKWTVKHFGEDTEKAEEDRKPQRSSTIHYNIDMIVFEEIPKLWVIKLYYQKHKL